MVCYFKVRQVLLSATILLQRATIITKCDRTRLSEILERHLLREIDLKIYDVPSAILNSERTETNLVLRQEITKAHEIILSFAKQFKSPHPSELNIKRALDH